MEVFFILLSLALIFLCGLLLGTVFEKLKLPSLLGMLITGIILGPHVLNLLSFQILSISADLRQIALIIILTRAGLALDIKDLLKVGRPAILMCFIPACFEIIGMLIFAPLLFKISFLEAAVLGSVIAAVSPAVIVPKMLKLIEGEYGTNKGVPQLIMAGASVDDVFVIVLFTVFTSLAIGGDITVANFITIPTAIAFGLSVGILLGITITCFFNKLHIRDSGKVIIFLSVSFLLVTLEHSISGNIGFSGLLAVMSMGATLRRNRYEVAVRLSGKFSKLWVCAEILLFVLVGASVDIKYAVSAWLFSIVLILAVLIFRMIGVYFCMLKTNLTFKEKLFCMIAYLPKATVQAAIGSIPMSMGLACGNIVLTVAVVSILITAPLGAFIIDSSYKKLLTEDLVD